MTQQEYKIEAEQIKATYAKAYGIQNIDELAELASMSIPNVEMTLEEMLVEFENCLEAQIN